jgi:hypothetical protein
VEEIVHSFVDNPLERSGQMSGQEQTSKSLKLKLLDTWHKHVEASRAAHYATARYYRMWNYLVGGPAIVLSGIVSSAILFRLADLFTGAWATVLVGLLSILVGALTTLQTFFKFSGKSELHREAGADYGAILREIEVAREKVEEGNEAVDIEFHISLVDMVKDIEGKMDDLGRRAPTVPQRIFADHLAALPENKSLRDKKKEAERKKKEAKRTAPVK